MVVVPERTEPMDYDVNLHRGAGRWWATCVSSRQVLTATGQTAVECMTKLAYLIERQVAAQESLPAAPFELSDE
jgi:hypothetical protein